jgi:ABC-2 type transport system permease protein
MTTQTLSRRSPTQLGSSLLHPAVVLATARRVLAQLRHDPRTLALLLVVPAALTALLKGVFGNAETSFDRIGPQLVGIFPFVTMFLVTSIATLRERTSGTLERLLTMPLAKLDLLLGYALAFAVFALLQVLVTAGVAFGLLGLTAVSGIGPVLIVALAAALLGTALGLFVSAFAATEFQAVQFLPAIVLPQFLVCGLLVPHGDMPRWLQYVADVTPLHYAVNGTTAAATAGWTGDLARDVTIVAGCAVLALAAGAATLRRRTD